MEADLARTDADLALNEIGPLAGVEEAVRRARAAQPAWASQPLAERLRVLRVFRRRLAADPAALARTAARATMSTADILVAEVMPLLAACRFLEQQAAAVLRERAPGRACRPVWLAGAGLRVRRLPWGVVLVIGPGNYPLFLPGVQALQALAAGNAVLVKPALDATAPMAALCRAFAASGLPDRVLALLPEAPVAAQRAIAAGVDKVVLTGSEPSGRSVAATLAVHGTPAVMELSGRDPMIVLEGASATLVARAVAYGLSLNAGATCIAPRRILAVGTAATALVQALPAALAVMPERPITPNLAAQLTAALDRARASGARVIGDAGALAEGRTRPLVVRIDRPGDLPELAGVFGPLATLAPAGNQAEAIAVTNSGAYALAASVFGPAPAASRCAEALRAGCVTINDLIAPTADPRLPFGGAGASGFGSTRGAEGLLEMTRPQAIIGRRRPRGRHFRALPERSTPFVAGLLRALYGWF